MRRPSSLSGDLRAEALTLAPRRTVPEPPYLAAEGRRASYGLALEFELQMTGHALLIGGASERVRFKSLFVEPFSDGGHDCGELFLLTSDFYHIQHARALLRLVLA